MLAVESNYKLIALKLLNTVGLRQNAVQKATGFHLVHLNASQLQQQTTE